MLINKLGSLLVVDDEIELMNALCDALTKLGYETTGVTSGAAALRLMEEKNFDLLVADLMMPEMDGIQLLSEAAKIDPHLIGIIMTGHGTVQTAVEAMKMGAFEYVLKPFKARELMAVSHRAMAVRRLKVENVQLRETLAVHELTRTIAHTLDQDMILNKTVDAAIQQMEADEASLMLPTSEGNELYVAAVRGESRGKILGARGPLEQGIAGWVARNRNHLVLEGKVEDPRFAPCYPRDDIGSSVSMPMLAGGRLVGVLNVNARRRRPFTLGQTKGLSVLAGAAAAAIEGAKLYAHLRIAEEKYRSIVENAIEGIYQTTPGGTFLAANPSYARILGYDSPEELVKEVRDITAQLYVYPERRAEFIRIMNEQGTVYGFEVQLVRKDGGIIWVSSNCRRVFSADGQYYEGTIEDITERKQLEEERTRVEAQLRQAQKMEALGTLAGGVTHDFNNILGIIMGYTEISLRRAGEGTPMEKNLQEVLSATCRAKELVKQILAFCRKTEQQRIPLQIASILKEAMKMLRASLPSTIEIKMDIQTQSLVMADPTQMHQVVMNLSANAAHAMRDSGGTLEINLFDVQLGSQSIPIGSSLRPGAHFKLTVSDTGHGVDPTIMDRIFDPFFTTKESGQGTGLGLSVVHGIIESHQGHIQVESFPGKGTTFTIFLPVLESESAPQATEADAGHLPRGNERILVVDDEPALAAVVGQMLEDLGYAVECQTSSVEALKVFRDQHAQRPFDLVITDMTMPHMTGADLARELYGLQPDLPIILLTGYSEKLDREDLENFGVQEFLIKPVHLGKLARTVRKILDIIHPERRSRAG